MKHTLTILTALLLAPLAALHAAEVSPLHEPTKPDWKVLDYSVSWVVTRSAARTGNLSSTTRSAYL